jgi:hypothetical protein
MHIRLRMNDSVPCIERQLIDHASPAADYVLVLDLDHLSRGSFQ